MVGWGAPGQDQEAAGDPWEFPQEDLGVRQEEPWKCEILLLWVTRMDDSQYLRSLVESMPRRMQEVIKKAGGMTKY